MAAIVTTLVAVVGLLRVCVVGNHKRIGMTGLTWMFGHNRGCVVHALAYFWQMPFFKKLWILLLLVNSFKSNSSALAELLRFG